MTLNTFPNTLTLAWSMMKSPNWSTRTQRAVSGRELRVSDFTFPLYKLTLTYEILRDRWDVRGGTIGNAYPVGLTPRDELRQIWNFYNQQMGPAIPFLYHDPTDNTSRAVLGVAQVFNFATGDGITTKFQITSPLLAPVIPDAIISVVPAGSTAVDFDTGIVTFAAPPAAGVPVGMDMTFNYRVRFASDSSEAEEFMYQLWQMKKLELVSVIE
jgi:uncharacterized protein (TIGR02217 family)